MLKNITLTSIIVLLSIASNGQSTQFIIQKGTHLPADSIQSKLLISSLNGFLRQSAKANKENEFVLKEDLLATSALLDEIKGMENGNGPEKKNIYQCYLTNVVPMDSLDYLV